MSSLPTWTSWVIVVACPLLGPMIAFLVVLPVAVLDRWISGAKGAPGPSGAPSWPIPNRLVATALGLSPSR